MTSTLIGDLYELRNDVGDVTDTSLDDFLDANPHLRGTDEEGKLRALDVGQTFDAGLWALTRVR